MKPVAPWPDSAHAQRVVDEDLMPVPYDGEHSPETIDLFGDFRELVPILVEGAKYHVPAHISVLRALQYVAMHHGVLELPWSRFCWNDTRGCCEMTYRVTNDGPDLGGRACRLPVRPGLSIVRLPEGDRSCRTA